MSTKETLTKIQTVLAAKYPGRITLKGNQKAQYDVILWALRDTIAQAPLAVFDKPEKTDTGYRYDGIDFTSKTQAFARFCQARSKAFREGQAAIDKAFGQSIKAFGAEFNGVKAVDLFNRAAWNCTILKGDNAGRVHGRGAYIGVNTELLRLLVFEYVKP
jgi:hypothetical protein